MKEIEAERPGVVQLTAVNAVGFESEVEGMAMLGDIPLLQDVDPDRVWTSWGAVYRDVVIVDRDGFRVEAYNLTQFDLSRPENDSTLKTKLLAVVDRD